MMWKIRCAVHDSTISKPTQFSHNITTSASCLGLKWLYSEIYFCCCSCSFCTNIRSRI